jgi:ABC-type amino acid transport substrate-binding protein
MRALLVLAGVLLLTGCGISIPSDPDGTLDRVSGGILRVGLAPNDGFTVVDDGAAVTGSEVELVEGFADIIDADIEWTVGSEEALVRDLEHGALDLVIGGITDATPWTEQTGMTRPYDEFTDQHGTQHKLVMLVPMGENAFLSALERFLTEAGSS